MKKFLFRAAAVLGAVFVLLVIFEMASTSDETVIADTLIVLKDGESRIWKLDAGSYRVDMTASDDGAAVEWVGAPCPGSGAVRELQTTCQFDRTGQLIVSNPSAFNSGASASVTVKITRLGRGS